jgi:hypothetical protein
MGAVSFVQRFGSTLNAHVHFHCWVIDGVFVAGADRQVQFAEAAALRPEDLAAVQQQVRRRVLRWFARASHLDAADARDMASWDHGGGFSLMLRSASKAPTAPAWNGCCAIARGRPLRWSASSSSARMRSSIASTSRSPMGVPSCG